MDSEGELVELISILGMRITDRFFRVLSDEWTMSVHIPKYLVSPLLTDLFVRSDIWYHLRSRYLSPVDIVPDTHGNFTTRRCDRICLHNDDLVTMFRDVHGVLNIRLIFRPLDKQHPACPVCIGNIRLRRK